MKLKALLPALLFISLFAKAQVDTVWEKVQKFDNKNYEIPPRFEHMELSSYLDSVIQFPIELQAFTKEHTVVNIFVDAHGNISNIKILKSVSPPIDQAIIKALSSVSNLKPAIYNNQAVALNYPLTVTFNINTSISFIRTNVYHYEPEMPVLPNTQAKPAQPDNKQIFAAVEKEPMFPGGFPAFAQFLGANIKYPKEAQRKHIQGRVILTFIVEHDGSLTYFHVLHSPDDELSLEALRVMKTVPNFEPGMQNGKPVRVQFTIPIAFTLNK